VFAAVPATEAAPTITANEMLITLTVQPAAVPKPSLKYLLLPELKEMTPGNPIEGYLECLLHQDFAQDKEALSPATLRQVDRAARMDKPDWQILPKLKTDGFALLLPDLQKMRFLASVLQERFRTELAQRKFDDAIVTAKTMFALGRHMGEHPTLIGDLVAVAIATVAITPLEEMLAQPGCPNLYWALTNLPSPFIPLDKGMEGERMILDTEFRDLSAETPMTPGQLRKFMDRIDYLKAIADKPPKEKTRAVVEPKAKDPAQVAAARGRLVGTGHADEKLLKFPPEQVILLDELRDLVSRRDDVMRLMNLPSWQFLESLKKNSKLTEESLLGNLGVAFEKVRMAQGRLDQRIALLRHVEAIRLYAADHKGALPAKLDDCTVPLPTDPYTGKPFRYAVEAGVAHLRGTPPVGYETMPAYNVHYEIRVGSRQ
jgi:hypothetical protein